MVDNCNGCHTKIQGCGIITKYVDRLTEFDVCPCGICLVKVVCYDACTEYSEFYHDIETNRKGNL